jgi:seryl-tRNA synthetase
MDPLVSYRERQQLVEIQQQFISNFNERVQLHRSLIELKDTNATNLIEIERLQSEIQRLYKDLPGMEDEKRDEKINNTTSEIGIITENIKANKETAVNLEKAIKCLENEAAKHVRVRTIKIS